MRRWSIFALDVVIATLLSVAVLLDKMCPEKRGKDEKKQVIWSQVCENIPEVLMMS
jgi:hypothetical protein